MEPTDYKTLPNLLRKYRKARGLKQNDVAKILGFKSSSRLSRWEQGARLPSLLNALRLGVVYRVMADALFFDHVRQLRKDIGLREESIAQETEEKGDQHEG